MIILSCCDIKYKKYADVMVASVLKNTRHKVSVDYLNIQWPYPRNVDFLASYRIRMFEQNLYRNENMCWLDSDMIVNKDISQLDQWLNEYATFAVETPDGPNDENKWLISVCGISKDPLGLRFLKAWRKIHDEIAPSMFPSIMTCQKSYYLTLKTYNWIKVKDVTYAYADKTMNPDSFIFDGRGDRKNSPEWAAESARYSGR